MKGSILEPWQENIIIYMLLLMVGNPTIIFYKSFIYTLYKVIFLAVVIWLLYKKNGLQIKIQNAKAAAFFACLITFSVIINGDESGISTLISYYVFILLGMFISEIIPPKSFLVRFTEVMFVLCVISLIFFSLLLIKPELLNRLLWVTVPVNEWGSYRSNIIYSAIMENFYSSADGSVVCLTKRNCGPFWEPGIFQCFISMSLVCLIENKKVKNLSVKRFIFLISALSTVSITGMLTLAVIVIYYTVKNVRSFAVYIAAGIMGLVIGFRQTYNLFFSRIADVFASHSLAHRIGLLELKIDNVGKSLLCGQGFDAGNYNGYITLFLQFGAVFLIIWLWLLYRGSNTIVNHRILFVVILLGLTSEPIAHSAFFWLIMFYGVNPQKERVLFMRDQVN